MAAAPSFRRGEVIARRYQVVTKSGETALWVGYHACDQGGTSHPVLENRESIPEPDVLVKVVKPDLVPEPGMREKLVRDLQRMRGLQHPGMPRLIDVQLLDEHHTVVLIEAIQAGLSQGVLLRRMATFRQKERFPLAEVRQIGAQLASALSYIHGQMLCHGDLRLEAVLLRPDGAKLCDTGLGAALPRGLYLEAVKKLNEVELLAPEVRAGRPPDPRADVFGLAALYRHLLSIGQGSGWDALLAEKPAMGLVLTRGMHEDPAQRYSSIEALIADIEAVALTGAPIRRRLAPTPLAMAVAAGRLPVEELSRPVEDLVPESARSRRNSGIFEVGAVLAPLSGAPSAKMSIGTIPPQLGGSNSSRSGRLTDGTSADSNPSASSRDGAASATSKGPTSATSKGPTSATSKGPASGISRGDRASRGSMPPPVETTEPAKASSRSKDGEPAAGHAPPPGAREAAAPPAPASISAPAGPPAAATSADELTPLAKSRPPREHAAPPLAVESASKPVSEIPGEESRSGRRNLSDSSGDHRADPGAKRTGGESGRSDGRGEGKQPSSSRSTSGTPRSRGEASSQRSKSGDSVGKSSTTTISLPPNALITSRLALVGALLLAALVGALVAVVVMLLLRPTSLLAPTPPPQSTPSAPAKPPASTPATPVSIPVVPIEGAPRETAPGEPGAAANAQTAPPPATAPAPPVLAPSASTNPTGGNPAAESGTPQVPPVNTAPVIKPAVSSDGISISGAGRDVPPLRLAGPPKAAASGAAPSLAKPVPAKALPAKGPAPSQPAAGRKAAGPGSAEHAPEPPPPAAR